MPSLIASQVLPILFPTATANTVVVLAPALSSTPTGQLITLRDTISGAPTGGTVTFTLPGGATATAPVVNGVAQVVNFPIPPGALAGAVTATYSGRPGFAGSTSSGAGNGTLTFCGPGTNSTELGQTLQTYAVLANSTVTNTGPTLIVGNVGVSPGSAVVGLAASPNPPAPGLVTGGTIHANDGPGVGTAINAHNELVAAIAAILLEPAPLFTPLTGDLGGRILTPGRYSFTSSAQLTGDLTLNDLGNPTALFEFRIGTTLTTASNSRVLFINGGADNVYWEVGSSATLGSATVFAGNILAQASITMNSTASIACGRALARDAGVTLNDNFIDPAPQNPKVLVPATAATNLVTGMTALLSVHASSPAGTASLRYTWSTLIAPVSAVAPTFPVNGTNGAQSTTVTFHSAGTYTFRVTITDPNGLSTTSEVTIVVKQVLTSIQVTPSTAVIHRTQADPVAARAFDQFGTALLFQPIFTWFMVSGIGGISSTGLYQAPNQPGAAIIRVSSGQVSGTATVTVVA